MKRDFVFTSQSVTEGHPDKLCDQISDAIVDQFLRQDPLSQVVAECAVSTGILFIAARYASEASVDIPEVARQVIGQVGYDREDFNAKTCSIMTSIDEFPSSQPHVVDERLLSDDEIERIPARKQVTAFGFACTQTAAYMPLPVWLAHKLARRLSAVRLEHQLPYLRPDGESQVAVEYREGRPHRIHSITLVASHEAAEVPGLDALRQDLMDYVIKPVFTTEAVKPDDKTWLFINPEGSFITGGPTVHSGLTGRKTGMDTYGEYCRYSGAALSGKDPGRVDRTAAYAARYAAKNVVAAGLAEECEVQLSYTIGLARPVSIQVETFGSGRIPDNDIAGLLASHIDFRPAAIVRNFNLRYLPAENKRGFYRQLATYGHMGRMEIGLPWEITDKAGVLRKAL